MGRRRRLIWPTRRQPWRSGARRCWPTCSQARAVRLRGPWPMTCGAASPAALRSNRIRTAAHTYRASRGSATKGPRPPADDCAVADHQVPPCEVRPGQRRHGIHRACSTPGARAPGRRRGPRVEGRSACALCQAPAARIYSKRLAAAARSASRALGHLGQQLPQARAAPIFLASPFMSQQCGLRCYSHLACCIKM